MRRIIETKKSKTRSKSKSTNKSHNSLKHQTTNMSEFHLSPTKTIKKSQIRTIKSKSTTTKTPKIPTMTDVVKASSIYADELNSNPLTPVVQSILDIRNSQDKIKFVAAPYIYIDRSNYIYEEKSKNYDLESYLYTDEDPETKKIIEYDIETDTDALSGPIADSVFNIFRKYKLGSVHTRFAGIMGIKIHNADGTIFGDHYVSYVYDNGDFAFFDSGTPNPCEIQKEENNTYIILNEVMKKVKNSKKTNRHKKLTYSCNTGIFETAAGASEDDKNYIGQNIFCHSWSMWFIYQFVVLRKSMTEIDALAGKGENADRNNLLRIKRFVYNFIIPKAKLDKLYTRPSFKPFSYYIHDPEFISGTEVSKTKKRTLKRYVSAIPELDEH